MYVFIYFYINMSVGKKYKSIHARSLTWFALGAGEKGRFARKGSGALRMYPSMNDRSPFM